MFWQLLRKEFLLIKNTPMLLWMNTLYPFVIIGILPFASTMDVKSLKTLILDEDRSELSLQLKERFLQSGYFKSINDVKGDLSFEEAYHLMEKGKADVIITLPNGFEKEIIEGNSGDISLIVNSINASKGTAAQTYSGLIVSDFQKDFSEKMDPTGATLSPDLRFKTLFNPQRDYLIFVLVGLMANVVILFSIVMPAIGLVQEKEFGTIEQINVTPVSPSLLLLSKALPYWIIMLVLMPLMLWISGIFYGAWFKGSFLTLMLITLLISIAFSGISLIIANFSSRMQQFMFMVILVMISVLFLGGVFMPVEGMPSWAQVIAKLLPNYYYIRDIRVLYLRGGGFADIWPGILITFLQAVLFAVLARVTYQKRD